MKIAFIGGGNMAGALIGGLMARTGSAHTVQVADPGDAARARLEQQWSINCFKHTAQAIAGMDVIVLAVKPQVLPNVLQEISTLLQADQLLVSIVAGATIDLIKSQLNLSPPVVRSMPNMPALIGMGITGLYADEICSAAQRDMAEELMRAAGEVVWLDKEALLNVVTAVSGSGPAYVFYLIEAMRNAGVRLGLPLEVAEKLALHTARGAGNMAVLSEVDIAELRHRVTSKGGTTQAAIEQLQNGHFEALIDQAIDAAARRGQELAGIGETP